MDPLLKKFLSFCPIPLVVPRARNGVCKNLHTVSRRGREFSSQTFSVDRTTEPSPTMRSPRPHRRWQLQPAASTDRTCLSSNVKSGSKSAHENSEKAPRLLWSLKSLPFNLPFNLLTWARIPDMLRGQPRVFAALRTELGVPDSSNPVTDYLCVGGLATARRWIL